MVNGDVPPRIKRDAHAMILEFIRSRPPLKKVCLIIEKRGLGLVTFINKNLPSLFCLFCRHRNGN